jgi:phage shock protein A
MGIFSRLTDIINSNINALLDRAEDPEKLIRLIIQEMEDTLVEVRSGTVKTIAEKKEIERRIAEVERERDDWQRKAEFALSKDREDLARGALVAKARLVEQFEVLTRQLHQIEDALAKSGEDIARLQQKLNDAKAREKALVARHKTAAQRLRMRSQIYDERITDAFARFEQIERSLDEMEGRVESYDIGRPRTLGDEFAELQADSQVEQELADLKARLHNRKTTGGTPRAES